MPSDDWRGEIDRLLAELRPDRYQPGVDEEWLDEVTDLVIPLIDPDEIVRRYARAEVKQREGTKTKSANKMLRDIHASGQWPLDWFEFSSLPISVGKERVALRAVKAADLRVAANDERRAAANDFAQRNAACAAMEWVADQMDANGWETLRDRS
jgi:hypothetical protein